MARIQIYGLDHNIEDSDKLVGTDGTIGVDLNKTKNFTLGEIKNYVNDSYKVYSATITQEGIAAPVPNILENTLGDVEFQYIEEGVFDCNTVSLFTVGKTTVDVYPYGDNGDITTNIVYNDLSVSKFKIRTYLAGSPASDILADTRLEIRVYN